MGDRDIDTEWIGEGDEVLFEVEQDPKSGKLAAIDLQVTNSATVSSLRAPRAAFGERGFDRRDREPVGRRSGGGGFDRQPAGAGSGVVKWFKPSKSFSFIQPNDGGGDVFVHTSAFERAGLSRLEDGQSISFEVEQERRTGKSSAINLRPG